jgi:PST family polysaccharide transporter
MSLVKTSVLNGIAVVVRIASALVLNKILAVYVGPGGYAVIGQFQNAVSVVVNLAGGLVATGVTKATAQHFDDEPRQHAVWQTAIRISLVASLIAGLSLLFIGDTLAQSLLHRADMSTIFIWLAVALPAMTANNLLMAIVNGKKEVGIYVVANITGSLISLVVTGLLAFLFGIYGALLAFTINPALAVLTTAGLVARRPWLEARHLWGRINRTALRELSSFGLMGLTSAVAVPVTYMLIRDHLTTRLGLPAAGYWQASWKISEIYLMLVTTTLTVYYLPRLAEIRTAPELKSEIAKVYRFVLPLVTAGAVTMFLLRDFIIGTLFTADFAPMRELFAWQLTGDVVKIGSWILAYIMLGRALVKIFVVSEISFSLSFFMLTCVCVRVWGLKGVAIAYAVNYSLYWIFMAYIIKNEMKSMKVKDILRA